MNGYEGTKDDLLRRLRRIEGQVRGVASMVESDRYCIDVLTQIAAVNRAMESVAVGMLEDHIRHCVVDAAGKSKRAGDEKISEAVGAISRLLKS